MKYRLLGSTGTSVGNLALGTMGFGTETSEENSFAVLDAFIEAGGNILDTADRYGDGASETTLGKWFAARPAGHVSSGHRRRAGWPARTGPTAPGPRAPRSARPDRYYNSEGIRRENRVVPGLDPPTPADSFRCTARAGSPLQHPGGVPEDRGSGEERGHRVEARQELPHAEREASAGNHDDQDRKPPGCPLPGRW